MSPEVLLSLAAAGFSAGLAVFALWRDRRSFSNRIFALGMFVLAAREVTAALVGRSWLEPDVLQYQKFRVVVASVIPGLWLLFSVSFARANFREFLSKWRWALLAAFALPVGLVALGWGSLFEGMRLDGASRWVLGLGWSGYGLHLFF